jgi:hypothetical protein
MLEEPRRRDDAMHWCEREEEVDVRESARRPRHKRPLVGRVAAKPTMGWQIEEAPRSWAGLHRWRANRCGALDDVDDDHRGSAVPADEGGPGRDDGLPGWRGGFGRDVQQTPHLRETGAAHRVGEQPLVTDAMESAGQHKKQEAPHKLTGLQRHGLVAGAPLLAIVLPAERHAVLIEGQHALVGDRYAVRIAREVREHGFGSRNGALGVHEPFAGASHWAKTPGSASVAYSPKNCSWPRRWASARASRKRRRNRRESTRTGRKKPGRHAIQRSRSGDSPPSGTMPCTCG